ncbi:MAG TPA: YcxB family protein [Clostridia bacterium]|nr:YcxB family protein [Clostridia bacterium]
MTAPCKLEDADYRAFRRHVLFRYRKIHWLYGGMLVLILSLAWFGGRPEETVADKIYLLIGSAVIFAGAGLVFYFVLLLISRFTGARFRGTVGEHVFEISDEGLTESNANGKIETRLGGIRRIDETTQHFFVLTTTGMGHVIPKRDLTSFDALRALQSRVAKN